MGKLTIQEDRMECHKKEFIEALNIIRSERATRKYFEAFDLVIGAVEDITDEHFEEIRRKSEILH